ncbi:competence protein ComGF [Geobacillus genomosp. 3]|uniref:Competence protein ComGF n=1 Tax=Geobacillus genomosp. 3 TaxID=1921421 RepID=S5ZEN8_GEOG3|nr:competence type IV pilus minor pilin ComGF [Geobacillus genomosp. 3]AGT32770.1 competence protein ComGF [Geobacillus genomosp. 3]
MRVRKAVAGGQGFTLLEALLALTAALTVAAVIPVLLSVRPLGVVAPVDGFTHLEWRLFLQQLQIELHETERWSADGTTLYLQKWNGDQVSFSFVKSNVIRQVNGTGNETALRHVQAVSYRVGVRGLFVQVTGDDGIVYEAFVARAF